jgi:glutamate-1-semialdehyde 2,1-aminomutase
VKQSAERLLERELRSFAETHPRSRALSERARSSLLAGVPMQWMLRWAGGFPVYAEKAWAARFRDVDGIEYVDFCLGDTGAMTGHSPEPVVRAVAEQLGRGITLMLPSEDALWVGEELTRRFGVSRWQFALTATDANRFAIRLARLVTGRPKVLVFNWCYHGTVDETFATLRGDAVVRSLTRTYETLLVIDETHTLCAGPGGYTAAHGLDPDVLTVGKAIGSGIPSAAYGFTEEVAARIGGTIAVDDSDVGGVGGTLAANVLSLAAMRATLTHVLTDEAFERMIGLGRRFEEGVASVIAEQSLPWHVTRLGCRVEYLFRPERPRNGSEAAEGQDHLLDRLIHLYALNRGVLLTPFHNMALMSPATSEADVDRHTEVFAAAAAELVA